MKDVPKYVVVIPQEDGSLYPLKFHSDYDEAVITANNHDASGSKYKAQIRSDGPEVWKAFEEKERQEKNASPGTKLSESTALEFDIPSEIEEGIAEGDRVLGPDPADQVSPETKVRLDNLRKEHDIKLVEFAEKLELDGQLTTIPPKYRYQFIPNEIVRPFGLLFWGPPHTVIYSIKIGDEEQLAISDPVSIRFFLNPYISFEALEYWVKHRVKLQYTNLHLMTMDLGSKLVIVTNEECVICVCGMKQEVSPGTKP